MLINEAGPTNAAGLALLRQFEGCRLQAYLDSGGIATIGYGHTDGVRLGTACTQEQAEAWLVSDVAVAASAVDAAVTAAIDENERAACVVLTFNIGARNFRGSSVCRLLNAGDRAGAANAFLLWCKARVGGKLVILPGLQRRRAAEAQLFLTPVASLPAGEEGVVGGEANPALVMPEESGVSTVERPPDSMSGKVGAGTALALTTGFAKEAIDRVQPVHDGLVLLGFSPDWIIGGLALLLTGALAYVGLYHWRAHRAGRA